MLGIPPVSGEFCVVRHATNSSNCSLPATVHSRSQLTITCGAGFKTECTHRRRSCQTGAARLPPVARPLQMSKPCCHSLASVGSDGTGGERRYDFRDGSEAPRSARHCRVDLCGKARRESKGEDEWRSSRTDELARSWTTRTARKCAVCAAPPGAVSYRGTATRTIASAESSPLPSVSAASN